MKPFKSIFIFGVLTSYVAGHINLISPVPYNPPPVLDPLKADGSNYPCQKTGAGFSVASPTNATVGSNLQLSFKGSATHNGGSCQVSLTKDGSSQLNVNSKFKVIYSIEGGCPGLNGVTNNYAVPIPSDVQAGDYTLAWTWFNNVGNREFYMNCAPITISGGSGTDATFNSLPDMAIYNIPTLNNCKTIEGYDVQFPNPGKYVLKASGFKPTSLSCNGGSASSPPGPSGNPGSGPSGSGATPSAPAAGTSTFNNGLYTPQVSAVGSRPSQSSSAKLAVSSMASSQIQASSATPSAAAPQSNTGNGNGSPKPAHSIGWIWIWTWVCLGF